MVINQTYVNESVIARMSFVPGGCYSDGRGVKQEKPYADILTTYGSQIQVKCSKEDYTDALDFLKKHRLCNCGYCGGNDDIKRNT